MALLILYGIMVWKGDEIMILLPEFEKFLKPGCTYSAPIDIIQQATKLVRDFKHGEASELFTDIPEEHLMSYAISYELLRVYHSWLTRELTSPDLKMW